MHRLQTMTAVLLASTGMAMAQAKQNPSPPAPQPPAASPQPNAQKDNAKPQDITASDFVKRAAESNMFEIRSSQQALERSDNEQVKSFAQRLMNDHRAATTTLQNAAVHQNAPSELDQAHQNMLQRLKQASDQNFDRRFLQMQVNAHRKAIQLFDDFASSGEDEQLQNFAEDTTPKLEAHLRRAQQLLASLDQQNNADATDPGQPAETRNLASNATRSLNVVQAPPHVTVLQRQATVDVHQPRPQITIHQPAPTITIEQPQPQITVRMPNPSVDVNQQQPKVSVQVPPPRLTSSGDRHAVVDVQRSGRQPKIDVQRAASPEVKFDRGGEPIVHYRQAAGQPQIRYEQMPANESIGGAAADQSSQHAQSSQNTGDEQHMGHAAIASERNAQAATDAAMPADQPDRNAKAISADDQDWVAEAQRRANDGDPDTTASLAGSSTRPVPMSVGDLENMSVYNGRGSRLGDVDRVIVDQDSNRKFVVLAHGGFLGMFQDEVAIPLNRIRAGDNRLYIHGLTTAEVSQMPDWENKIPNYRELGEDQTATVQPWK